MISGTDRFLWIGVLLRATSGVRLANEWWARREMRLCPPKLPLHLALGSVKKIVK
jgi:hypothetical protein